MTTATIDDFDLDIRLHEVLPIKNYPEPTQQGTCHSRDVSCYWNCNTTFGPGCGTAND